MFVTQVCVKYLMLFSVTYKYKTTLHTGTNHVTGCLICSLQRKCHKFGNLTEHKQLQTEYFKEFSAFACFLKVLFSLWEKVKINISFIISCTVINFKIFTQYIPYSLHWTDALWTFFEGVKVNANRTAIRC